MISITSNTSVYRVIILRFVAMEWMAPKPAGFGAWKLANGGFGFAWSIQVSRIEAISLLAVRPKKHIFFQKRIFGSIQSYSHLKNEGGRTFLSPKSLPLGRLPNDLLD